MENTENLLDIIREEEQKGNICFKTVYCTDEDSLVKTSLKEFVNQPADGILFDLTRSPHNIITTASKNPRWINDYAMALVIQQLQENYEELKTKYDEAIKLLNNQSNINVDDHKITCNKKEESNTLQPITDLHLRKDKMSIDEMFSL